MSATIDAFVSARFDLLEARFRSELGADDFRLAAIRRAVETGIREPDTRAVDRSWAGLDVLDLGCGKGRFSRHFAAWGAHVVGVDGSLGMLGAAAGLPRARAYAGRLPFRDQSFDVVVAVEVFQHLARPVLALAEIGRVLRPGGIVLIVDRNALALDARRPWVPSVVLKWVDERRGRWMYPSGSAFRERWRRPGAFAALMSRALRCGPVRVEYLLAPEEARWRVFRGIPAVRRMVLWGARKEGVGDG
jgi:SAM-dependent methyltransferase